MNANLFIYAQGIAGQIKSGKGERGPWLLVPITCLVRFGKQTVNCWFFGNQVEAATQSIREGHLITCVGIPKIGRGYEDDGLRQEMSVSSWFDGGDIHTTTPE